MGNSPNWPSDRQAKPEKRKEFSGDLRRNAFGWRIIVFWRRLRDLPRTATVRLTRWNAPATFHKSFRQFSAFKFIAQTVDHEAVHKNYPILSSSHPIREVPSVNASSTAERPRVVRSPDDQAADVGTRCKGAYISCRWSRPSRGERKRSMTPLEACSVSSFAIASWPLRRRPGLVTVVISECREVEKLLLPLKSNDAR